MCEHKISSRSERLVKIGQRADRVRDTYDRMPARALVSLSPFASAVQEMMISTLTNLSQEGSRVFWEEFERGGIQVTDKIAESDKFVHCFRITAEATRRAFRHAKIRMLARLLRSGLTEGGFSDVDEYERYLGILDELTYDEIRLLALLDTFESSYGSNVTTSLRRNAIQEYWGKFKAKALDELKIPEREIDNWMTRLGRTGCFQGIPDTKEYRDFEDPIANVTGYLTDVYRRLRDKVEIEYGSLPDEE